MQQVSSAAALSPGAWACCADWLLSVSDPEQVASPRTDCPPLPAQGSAFERALQHMMGGGLAGGGEAERELGVAPSWMSGDPKAFSEEQLRQWREWQAREKAYVEERVKRQGEALRCTLTRDCKHVSILAAGTLGSLGMQLKKPVLCPAILPWLAQRDTSGPCRPPRGGAAQRAHQPGGGVCQV